MILYCFDKLVKYVLVETYFESKSFFSNVAKDVQSSYNVRAEIHPTNQAVLMYCVLWRWLT